MTKAEKQLLLASNLWYLGEGLFGPLFAVYSQRLGGNVLDITWAWAMYLVVTGAATMIVGKFATNRGRQLWLTIIGYALNTLLTFGYLFVATPGQLMLIQAGLGLASALATPTWYALYASADTNSSSGAIWGRLSGQTSIFTAVALVLGGLIASRVSFQALFVTMGFVHLAATLSVAQIFKSDYDEEMGESVPLEVAEANPS